MVALKFGMFRELARSNEEFAMKNVKKLKGKPLGGCAKYIVMCTSTEHNDVTLVINFYSVYAYVFRNRSLFLVSTNVEIKKTLESVYDELRVAGKTYSQVCMYVCVLCVRVA